MSISTSISRLRFYFWRNGIRATLRRAAQELRRTLFANRMAVSYSELCEAGSWPAPFPSSITMERKQSEAELDPQDLEEIGKYENLDLVLPNWKERFEKGAACWLIRTEGHLAGYNWCLRGGTMRPYFFPLLPNDVHFFDAFVFPPYRGKRLNLILVNHMLRSLREESAGQGYVFLDIAEWNRPQLTSLGKNAYPSLGRASIWTIFGRTIVYWENNGLGASRSEAPAILKHPRPTAVSTDPYNAISRLSHYHRRRSGIRAALRRAVLGIRGAFDSHRVAVCSNELSEFLNLSAAHPATVSIERKESESELDPRDLQEILNYETPPRAPSNIGERFGRGASLWMIKTEGKLVGYAWTLRGGTMEPPFVPLGVWDVHIFDTFVFPQYRGRSLNPMLLNDILRNLAAESMGRGRAYCEVAEGNEEQLSAMRMKPYRVLGWARKFTFRRHTLICWDRSRHQRAEQETASVQQSSAFPAQKEVRFPR